MDPKTMIIELLARIPLLFSGLFLFSGLLILVDYARMLFLRRRLPPGPFPFPIVGNHFQLPKTRPWIEWEKWAEYYNNPMTTIWVGRHPRILLQDAWVASELMEKRADIWSSRPRLIVMGDLINATETNQTTLVYGDRWRVHRKLMHTAVGSQAVRNHRAIQANESKVLIRDVLEEPDDYVLSIERYSVSTTSIIGWGRRIDRKNDYVAQQALAIMEGVNFVVPGKYLMEAVPALTKLPSWIYTLPNTIRGTTTMLQKYFYMLSQEGAESKWNNFSKVLLNGQETYGLSDVEVAGLTANLIGGGVDTTSSTMISCILAMAVFPDVQRKAQAEIDYVVGDNASPNWEDVDGKLPYCTALVKETLRWRTVTVLAGIPHANTVDFDYRGYHFPAGTNITGNIWAIHRNPRDFPEPDNFRPERFLNGSERPYPNNKGMNPFGWGRRQCSGQPLAEQGLLYSLTRLLWAFDIKPGIDDKGHEVKLDIFAYTDSENMRPEPFKARFAPRTERIRELIVNEAASAREELRVYDGETRLTLEDALQALASDKKLAKAW